jgi:lipopolysaccharide export system protein LptA
MRGTRWLLLAAIAAILGGIGYTYRVQKKAQEQQAPPKPAPLPINLNSSSQLYYWRETDTKTGRVTDIYAEDVRELRDSPRVDLKGVTLKLYSEAGDTYDLVKCSEASFFKNEHRLYADGDVEITLKVPAVGEPKRELISIRTSGVTFGSTTGRAETDRPSSFIFDRGSGSATGASYDPATHALVMKSNAQLNWRPGGPKGKTMKIEAGSLEYNEATSQILLKPWGRLTRENTVVEGNNVVVYLQADSEGSRIIRKLEAGQAHGTDRYPNRKLDYSADALWMDFDEQGRIQKIIAQTDARLVSTSVAAETTITAYHVELLFEPKEDESLLTQVSANGNSVVTSKPLPVAGRQPGQTHVLCSDLIDMRMRPGGREIEHVVTHAPGTLEFLPNLPAQRHRLLEAREMQIGYGAESRIESFRATEVRTETDPNAEEVKRKVPRSVTTSRTMSARFDPATSRMATMEQSGDFAYDQGDRKARAAKATLDGVANVIHLETSARMWDAGGSTSADRIRLDQQTGDFTAEGDVTSSRLPEKNEKKNPQMLSGEQPLQARAARMESSNGNRKIRYSGGASMWQGANRIEAKEIEIDREKRTLIADGNVVTNLWEGGTQPAAATAPSKKKSPAAPVLTVVRAPRLVYTEENRLALYSGGVVLKRPNLDVKGREIRAYLAQAGGDSRLERALADGSAEIVQTSRAGVRTGAGEHAEYHAGDQRVSLRGGAPKLVERTPDGRTQTTEGADLTYFANDDRLLVNGSPARPGQSRIQRK